MAGSAEPRALEIAIVGGGVGGLMAARVMQTQGLKLTVFEREPSRESRTQGGTLDLHSESGQWALKEAGLEAEFRAIARVEGQDTCILDAAGTLLWEELTPPDLMERPEVDRSALRDILLDSLEPDTVQWGHQLIAIQPLEGTAGWHELCFANGVTRTAGLVVGADGAWSRVRSLLTPAEPEYCGVSAIELGIPDATTHHPGVAQTVGRGILFALGDNRGFIAQRTAAGHIRVYVMFRMAEDGFASLGISFEDPASMKASILAQFEGWAPQITDLVRACNGVPRIWPVYALPIGLRWESRPGITLVGDAAHLMSPFGGAGANLAMLDGATLALELIKCSDSAVAIPAYEAQMHALAEPEARQSAGGLEMCLSKDGAHRLAKQMASYQGQREYIVSDSGVSEFGT